MFVTPAYAQTTGAGGGADMLMTFFPIVLIFVIMYFLVLRPQRQQMKAREAMLGAIRRNDTVVTGGGMVGKVTKVFEQEGELEVEVAPNMKVRVVRSMVADVRAKGDPAKA